MSSLGEKKYSKRFTLKWSKEGIDFVTERELFLGTSKDTFSPNESMTRAEVAVVIERFIKTIVK